ncbi:hypothetical protein B0A77_11000 [Flavobacterium branchiophilum]|uniref:Lipoprotein n=1 Tax=Flavobacterium branchiophilum TaxID=55197 RepID=A0A2H3KA33_9FLAO|nr:hypothetical protein B0A77_11000 [Flavobacterium branchiophilum]
MFEKSISKYSFNDAIYFLLLLFLSSVFLACHQLVDIRNLLHFFSISYILCNGTKYKISVQLLYKKATKLEIIVIQTYLFNLFFQK